MTTFNLLWRIAVLWSRDPPLLDDTSDLSCFRPLRAKYSSFRFFTSHVPVSLKPHMSTEQKSPDFHSLSTLFFVLLLAHGLTPLNRSSAAENSLASTCFSHSALVLITSPLGISAWLIWQKGRRGGGGCLIDSFEGLEPHYHRFM